MPDVLTHRERECVREVASQYDLTPTETERVLALVNKTKWEVPDLIYFKAYLTAHTECARIKPQSTD